MANGNDEDDCDEVSEAVFRESGQADRTALGSGSPSITTARLTPQLPPTTTPSRLPFQYLGGVPRSSRRNQPRVDLSKLEVPTLKKYRRVFNLSGAPDSKEELVPAVARHFAAQVVDEDDILLNFAFSLKKQYLARSGLLPKKAKGKSSGKGKK